MSEDRPNIYPYRFEAQSATATAASNPASGAWADLWTSGSVTGKVIPFTTTVTDTGVSSGRYVVDVQDTGDAAINRLVVLHNGAKVNLSGAADADTSYGAMQFVVRCWGTHPGACSARYDELTLLRGLQGTMLARVYKTTDEIYRSCLGVITSIRPTRRAMFPVTASKRSEIDAVIVFDRLTAWGNEYTVT